MVVVPAGTPTPAPAARSFLYAPGDRPDRFPKALASGADAVILDLEDGVDPAAKDAARANVSDALDAPADDGVQRWVRVNSDDRFDDDLAAVLGRPGLHGVLVPKAAVALVERAVDAGAPRVAPLVESAEGLLQVEAMALVAGVSHLALGEADLVADLGADPGPDRTELAPIRMRIVIASAAAGIAAPTAPVSTAFRDLDAFRVDTEALRRMGFGARACIHPAQVPVVHEVLSVSPEALAWAEDVLRRFAEAGGGVCVDAQGRMVDEAVVRAARRILSLAR